MSAAPAHRDREHRLEVDWTLCDGHGLCARIWPERIGFDDWGFPVVDDRPVGEHQLPHARRAASICPRLALRLEPS
ncbi:ferredoxin [Nocardioides sp. DS6]|uniref:Ferredoxin n=1 Tax=Nocardioides eburneus TaxID=3231482 RepID=A0ABV3T3E8_9ACTN